MSNEEDVVKQSYINQSEYLKKYIKGSKEEIHSKTWLDTNTVDAWRHRRMYQLLDPLLTIDPNANWVTVGDGRFGLDAQYIANAGCQVLPTDISDTLLKKAYDLGIIKKFQVENAEKLTFENESFDYVFCKESYHHFPRPTIALYEMLRIAKKGVILIEPNDVYQ